MTERKIKKEQRNDKIASETLEVGGKRVRNGYRQTDTGRQTDCQTDIQTDRHRQPDSTLNETERGVGGRGGKFRCTDRVR